VSDNTTPPPAGGTPYTPPPAPPVQPTQAYPGAAPVYGASAAPGYGQPQPPVQPGYGAPHQPYGYAQNPYPVYPAPRPTSGLAITSLVCGIVSLLFSWLFLPALASIAAVITGHMALKKTKNDPTVGGRGMAFAGLILGYVVLGIGVLTIAISLISLLAFGAFTLPFLYNS
jgi:hypothetical protein